ncbi:MAG: transcription antitermination protein NusB [Bacteroidales bacterium]|nr:transcription antitermination protein NusB [Bacteroidales bacterium]
MISRTLIRTKAFKELYSRITTENTDTSAAEKELMQSLEMTRRLYCLMALLPSAMIPVAEDKISQQMRKFKPDLSIVEQNRKFADNAFSALIKADAEFNNWCTNSGISWSNLETPLKSVYSAMVSSRFFKGFVRRKTPVLADALNLFRHVYSSLLSGNSVLEDALESECIWWADDLDYVLEQILKNLKGIAASGYVAVPELFEEEADKEFARKLVGSVIVEYDDLAETVTSYMSNWDVARVVQSDILLVAMGLAEAKTFRNIPFKVTIDEYVELAKHYSTPKSYSFVNGLLNTILKDEYSKGNITKDPAGMVGGF